MYVCACIPSHQSAVMGVAFSPSGEFFSSVGADEEVSLPTYKTWGVRVESQ